MPSAYFVRDNKPKSSNSIAATQYCKSTASTCSYCAGAARPAVSSAVLIIAQRFLYNPQQQLWRTGSASKRVRGDRFHSGGDGRLTCIDGVMRRNLEVVYCGDDVVTRPEAAMQVHLPSHANNERLSPACLHV